MAPAPQGHRWSSAHLAGTTFAMRLDDSNAALA